MVKNIIKRLSESIKSFISSIYELPDDIRLRRFYAVACMFCLFIMLVFININSSDARPIEEKQCQKEVYSAKPQSVYVEEILSESDAGITAELNETYVEPESIRENNLYYIEDNGHEFYLDQIYQDYLWEKLKEYDHTDFYEVCLALMYHESKFDINAISATNDHGLMQIHGGNYDWLHDKLDIDSLDDPYDNIDCGVYLLVSNYNKYGNIDQALIAYHQGSAGSATSTRYSRCILEHDMDCLTLLEEAHY